MERVRSLDFPAAVREFELLFVCLEIDALSLSSLETIEALLVG